MTKFFQRLVPKLFSEQQKERRQQLQSMKDNFDEMLSDNKNVREMLDMPEDATFGEIRAEIDKRLEAVNNLAETMEWAENEMESLNEVIKKKKKIT